MPEDADSPRFRTNIGSVHYAPEKSAIIWKIKQFGGGKEFLMRAELGLPSVKGDDEHGGGMTGGFGGSMGGAGQSSKSKRPISIKFEIPYFTTSGIQVRYLKIIEPKVSRSARFPLLSLSRPFPLSLPPFSPPFPAANLAGTGRLGYEHEKRRPAPDDRIRVRDFSCGRHASYRSGLIWPCQCNAA